MYTLGLQEEAETLSEQGGGTAMHLVARARRLRRVAKVDLVQRRDGLERQRVGTQAHLVRVTDALRGRDRVDPLVALVEKVLLRKLGGGVRPSCMCGIGACEEVACGRLHAHLPVRT